MNAAHCQTIYNAGTLPIPVGSVVEIWASPAEKMFSIDNYKSGTGARYNITLPFEKIIDVSIKSAKVPVTRTGYRSSSITTFGDNGLSVGSVSTPYDYTAYADQSFLCISYLSNGEPFDLVFRFPNVERMGGAFEVFDRLKQHCPNLISHKILSPEAIKKIEL